MQQPIKEFRSRGHGVVLVMLSTIWACVSNVHAQIATELENFFLPGSQPSGLVSYEPFIATNNCKVCHEAAGTSDLHIFASWQGSMMAQAARDPLFHACLAIANQDAAFAGDLCIRCHTPGGWISGRSSPTDGSALISADRDGVSCSVCHRLVNPVFTPESSPAIDEEILSAILNRPAGPGNGAFVLDPFDRRRGPYDNVLAPGHFWLPSEFLRSSALCGTCHDVSNPLYTRKSDGSYAMNPLGAEHPTGRAVDMFPLERTYSEWLNSEFATGGVEMNGRFGGSKRVVSTCQDCHMPKITGRGCSLDGAPVRSDLGAHEFSGGNAWVQDLVLALYPNDRLNAEYLEQGKLRSISMLQRAATLSVTQLGNRVRVRVVNETGHKLFSGYPEGRRMWLGLKYYDDSGALLKEIGAYDPETAILDEEGTKIYEVVLGLSEGAAEIAGLLPGPSFHFALNNVVVKDNRIPPRGFTNAAFRSVQAEPIGNTYADGQYWDDTTFPMPVGTSMVAVNLFYQTASKEFITFLRDENRTNDAGQTLYNLWEVTEKSPPVLMAESLIHVHPFATGDVTGDGRVDLADYSAAAGCLDDPGAPVSLPQCASFDFDDDGDVDFADLAELLLSF